MLKKNLMLAFGICGLVLLICFTVYNGLQSFDKQYDSHLTQKQYNDVVLEQNVQLVFYKKTCPYCRAGKNTVIEIANKSSYPTFYINIQTKEGEKLVHQYGIKKAATVVSIRKGSRKSYLYAKKDNKGHFIANKQEIKEAFHE
ncbi:thioredoxin [Streptococcus anginosus]|uniref:thioredoxin domain-containing protein n=1 Tax=Streptococcus anginosus TaxID=1328 RepID=UPI001430C31A|nr:thioredoxin domain-containing protein [Streptococcus anginosus]NJJ27008.1 thioredoxin [Streptococcus anginosus]